MFAPRYFAPGYFAPRYFPPGFAVVPPAPEPEQRPGGSSLSHLRYLRRLQRQKRKREGEIKRYTRERDKLIEALARAREEERTGPKPKAKREGAVIAPPEQPIIALPGQLSINQILAEIEMLEARLELSRLEQRRLDALLFELEQEDLIALLLLIH